MATGTVVTNNARNLAAGQNALPTMNKRGELINGQPWHVQLALEGKVYTCGVGQITTPISSNVNLVIDDTQPAFMLRVPVGTTVIPLWMHAYYEATGAAIAEGAAYLTDSDPGSGTSSALTRTPVNMKTRGPGSTCTGAQIVTASLTFVNNREFWRFGEPADLDGTVTGKGGFSWSYLQNSNIPIAVGPATINCEIACGTSSSIFFTMVYAEFVSSDLE